jgi:hypothetical protein
LFYFYITYGPFTSVIVRRDFGMIQEGKNVVLIFYHPFLEGHKFVVVFIQSGSNFFQFNTIKNIFSEHDRPAMIVPFFQIVQLPEQVSGAKLMGLNICLEMTPLAIVYQNRIFKSLGKTLFQRRILPPKGFYLCFEGFQFLHP